MKRNLAALLLVLLACTALIAPAGVVFAQSLSPLVPGSGRNSPDGSEPDPCSPPTREIESSIRFFFSDDAQNDPMKGQAIYADSVEFYDKGVLPLRQVMDMKARFAQAYRTHIDIVNVSVEDSCRNGVRAATCLVNYQYNGARIMTGAAEFSLLFRDGKLISEKSVLLKKNGARSDTKVGDFLSDPFISNSPGRNRPTEIPDQARPGLTQFGRRASP